MEYPLEILTPDGMVYNGNAESISVNGEAGSFGVLAHHTPMIAAIKPGVLSLRTSGGTSYYAVGMGVVEVTREKVVILADIAESAESKEDAIAKVADLPENLYV